MDQSRHSPSATLKYVEAMEKIRKIRFDYVEGELERLRERLSDAHADLTAGPSQENLTRRP